jgi:hypothetical protein
MYIAAKCSWSFVYCVIILCVFFYYVCIAFLHTLVAGCRLEVSIRKVLRPATSAQAFLGFSLSIKRMLRWFQDSKLLLHASHVAIQT